MNIGDQLELARHLGVTDRRVRQLEAEHIVERLDGEPTKYDIDVCARRFRLYANYDIETVCRELEQAAEEVDRMLTRMRPLMTFKSGSGSPKKMVALLENCRRHCTSPMR